MFFDLASDVPAETDAMDGEGAARRSDTIAEACRLRMLAEAVEHELAQFFPDDDDDDDADADTPCGRWAE